MKITLTRNKVAPPLDVPSVFPDKLSGLEVPDYLAIQYEQARLNFIATRDALINAYKGAGGEY